jgi:hypothetical protein
MHNPIIKMVKFVGDRMSCIRYQEVVGVIMVCVHLHVRNKDNVKLRKTVFQELHIVPKKCPRSNMKILKALIIKVGREDVLKPTNEKTTSGIHESINNNKVKGNE